MKALDEAAFTIVGTGLMGTSLALALRGKVKTLIGIEANPPIREAASPHFERMYADLATCPDLGDVIVLATPIRVILRLLEQLTASPPKPETLILDLGSTKAEIVRAMNQLPDTLSAVGGHPMCGKETSGPEAAEGTLFQNAVFVLCQTQRTTPQAWALAQQFVQAIHSRLLILDAEQHDRAASAISHLPYMLSAALVDTVSAITQAAADDTAWQIAASGFRDTSRLASSDLTMMRDILATNSESVLAALDIYQARLSTLRALIANGDEAALMAALVAIRSAHQAWKAKR